MIKKSMLSISILLISACTVFEPEPFEVSDGHIKSDESPIPDSDIPELVEQVPVLPEPSAPEQVERYTVVVNEVPVKELLFALARDAKVNVDIHPDITGNVTINAVEQTLPQILQRISRQVDLRYEYDGDNLVISTDTPFFRTYKIDYVNLTRDTTSTSTVSTQISSTSGGDAESVGSSGNTSTTDVSSESNHHFWARLVSNVSAVLGDTSTTASGGNIPVTESVIPNPESGVLTVKATAAEHEQIQNLIDQILVSAKRQVLIQTTIAEVTLNERYRAGIDWNALSRGAFNIASVTAAGIPVFIAGATASSFVVRTDASDNQPDSISGTITLLDEFGDVNTLSSPQLIALNNQTALLKVVENLVYFEIESDTTTTQGAQNTTVDTTAKTVPVGLVMTVTPQIDANGTVTLVVRPTISRFIRNVPDPNPEIPAGTENNVPQIAVREMESVLRLNDGQIGILGGLMTDEARDNDAGLPGVKDVDFFGNIFKTTSAEYTKTELVIFIKPIIINDPNIDTDLEEYKKYLSREYRPSENRVKTGEGDL